MMVYLLFILGFAALIKGADLLVDGSSSIAKRYKVSNIVIGLTIVSFGTSAPELIVNLFASGAGEADLAIGNVFGSNISNVLLILGVSALIYPLDIGKNTAWKEIPLSLLAAIVLGFLCNDLLIDGFQTSALTRIDGLVLLSFFVIFVYYTFGIAKINNKNQVKIKKLGLVKSIIFILLGLVGLGLGGKWIVDGAIAIALKFGLSQALIGLTVVAIGTSLPELAASAMAAYKKNAELAIGNVVGSNIFNVLWILGLSSVVKTLPFDTINNIDLLMVVFSSLLLFIFIFIDKKNILQRWQGGFFLLTYCSYLIFLIIRG
ncbi:MAG: calcium/sodium antiporter [Candidatus Moranbacteria bacterium]|nr:calcium/sodium antiporter [Candidatus Moranbacteria bacterium]